MAILNYSAAARAAGVARSTIQRHVKSGKLSATTRPDGGRGIDTAELLRVFGELHGSGEPPARSRASAVKQHFVWTPSGARAVNRESATGSLLASDRSTAGPYVGTPRERTDLASPSVETGLPPRHERTPDREQPPSTVQIQLEAARRELALLRELVEAERAEKQRLLNVLEQRLLPAPGLLERMACAWRKARGG